MGVWTGSVQAEALNFPGNINQGQIMGGGMLNPSTAPQGKFSSGQCRMILVTICHKNSDLSICQKVYMLKKSTNQVLLVLVYIDSFLGNHYIHVNLFHSFSSGQLKHECLYIMQACSCCLWWCCCGTFEFQLALECDFFLSEIGCLGICLQVLMTCFLGCRCLEMLQIPLAFRVCLSQINLLLLHHL